MFRINVILSLLHCIQYQMACLLSSLSIMTLCPLLGPGGFVIDGVLVVACGHVPQGREDMMRTCRPPPFHYIYNLLCIRMPRSSRSSGGRSAPSGSRSVPSGARGSHSMAAPHPHQQQSSYHPNQQAHAPGAAQQQRGSGLFGQVSRIEYVKKIADLSIRWHPRPLV